MNKPSLDPFKQRWKSLGAREQTLVLVAAGVVLLALLWWVALAPAIKTLRTAPAAHAALDRELQRMRTLQQEALELQKVPRTEGAEAARSLQTSVTQQLGASAQLNVVGDRATLSLKPTAAQTLAPWLAQVRSTARAVPIEAKLVRSTARAPAAPAKAPVADAVPAPMQWEGSIVLALPPG